MIPFVKRAPALFFLSGILITCVVLGTYYYFAIKIPGEACLKQYTFTSPTLGCAQYDESVERLRTLDGKLQDASQLYTKEGKVKRLSVWVRHLESKQWAAVNQHELYAPASLIKVPLMLAYFKLIELEPTILDQQIENNLSTDQNEGSLYPPADSLIKGKRYSVRELIERMIVESDNNATALLYNYINPDFFQTVLTDLGLRHPGNDGGSDISTAKSYANVFRILYNTSYLNREYSEYALELLSQPRSFNAIAEPLPKGTLVADKFGERTTVFPDRSTTQELHDCGIVYKRGHTYTVCIMTEGSDFDALTQVIKDISLLVYSSI